MIADFDRYYEQRFAVFEKLWPRIARFMGCYGREGTVGSGNYGVLDDFNGYQQVRLGIYQLELMRPSIVHSLQRILSDFLDGRLSWSWLSSSTSKAGLRWVCTFVRMLSSTTCVAISFQSHTGNSIVLEAYQEMVNDRSVGNG